MEIQKLVSKIEELLDLYYSNRSRTLPVRINKRKQNIIVTWNIFPTDKILLEDLFHILTKTIEENLKNVNGEVIHCVLTNGKIRDRGDQEFQIHKGKTWEIYLYDPEIYVDVRFLFESRITQPLDEWLSIDIDIVMESAWFAT